jgi:hypothetical protein
MTYSIWIIRLGYLFGLSLLSDAIWQSQSWPACEAFFGIGVMVYVIGAVKGD